MTVNERFSTMILAAFCAALPVLAQTQTVRTPAPRPHQPYTAEFNTTRVQTLANGTTITTETKELIARDQQLRRLSSITNSPAGDRPAITTVHISDPAAGVEINWNSSSKVAHEVRRPVGADRHGCWATPDGRYRANYSGNNANMGGTMLQPPPTPPDASAPVNSPLASTDSAPRVVSSGNGPGSTFPLPRTASPVDSTLIPGPNSDQRDIAHEDLGADNIMGVEVRGSRTTITTPAGAQGNDEPLVSTTEEWMAPSLGLTLRSISDDPRIGKSDREVVSLELSDPDLALFQPPAGYQLDAEVMQPVPCAQ
ncbi:MAG: hypothetical protein ABR928_14100 [Terracidiphilus sp.]